MSSSFNDNFKRVFNDTVDINVHRVGDRCVNVYEAQMEMCWQEKPEVLGEKPVPFKLCPQQKPTRNSLGFKRGLKVRSRSLNF